MQTAVEGLIYFYLFICIALLAFNVVYIAHSKHSEALRKSRARAWEQRLTKQGFTAALTEKQLKSLKKIDQLIAWNTVVMQRLAGDPENARTLVRNNRQGLRELAVEYGRKQPMERAYFAYVVSSLNVPSEQNSDMLAEILLQYLPGSTVFCRENVLHALYTLGLEQPVEHALEILSENGWYHSPKLLSDGLPAFNGDKHALVRRLWARRGQWEECILVGLIQFASSLPGEEHAEAFLEALSHEDLPMEARFALLRYFQRHRYEPARRCLLDLLEIHVKEEGQLAVAAAAALQSYPGTETKAALLQALHSRSWYIRRNAAFSLQRLGVTEEELDGIRRSGDRYALEMMVYVAETVSPAVRKEAAV